MGIALDLVAVHVSAGIAFVSVADDELLVGDSLAQELPLIARQKSGAAAAPQLGGLDLLDDQLRLVVDQRLIKRLVATDRDVLLDVVGIDQPAITQHDLLLSLEKGNVVPRGYVGKAVAVADGSGDMVPPLDLAVDEAGIDIARGEIVQNTFGVVGLHPMQDQKRPARDANIDQRLVAARSEADHAGEIKVRSTAVDLLDESVVK